MKQQIGILIFQILICYEIFAQDRHEYIRVYPKGTTIQITSSLATETYKFEDPMYKSGEMVYDPLLRAIEKEEENGYSLVNFIIEVSTGKPYAIMRRKKD